MHPSLFGRHSLPGRIIRFYVDGFSSMTLGRTLWKLILIKLFIMFAVLKFFFFPDFLATRFADDQQRAAHVLDELTPAVRGATGMADPQ